MRLKQRTVFRGEDGEIYKTIRPPRSSVKVWKDETDDGVEATHVRVPISSTSEDRDGDEFTEDGLDYMIEQLQAGDVPMFLDHGISPETGFQDYRALEAVGGWKDGEKEDGVVYGIGVLDPDHEDAETLAKRLENGIVPVGWSVGFIPHETESKGDDGEGERFLEHDLLEVSSVGIPSNPDGVSASIAQAAKGFARSRGVDLDAEAFARSMTETLEKAIEKQTDGELELVADAIETFRSETDADEPTVADFVEWASDTKEEDELAVIASVVESLVEDLDADEPGAVALDVLESEVEQQLEEGDGEDDGDEEEEGADGDEDDDGDEEEEEGTEPEETDDDGDAGETITTDTVDAIVEGVGEAVGRELEQHREIMLEQLDAEPTDTDDDGGDGDGDEDEDGDEDDGDGDTDSADDVDSSTASFAGEPRAIASFRGAGDDDGDAEERDEDGETTEKEGTPAGPTFNPGTTE